MMEPAPPLRSGSSSRSSGWWLPQIGSPRGQPQVPAEPRRVQGVKSPRGSLTARPHAAHRSPRTRHPAPGAPRTRHPASHRDNELRRGAVTDRMALPAPHMAQDLDADHLRRIWLRPRKSMVRLLATPPPERQQRDRRRQRQRDEQEWRNDPNRSAQRTDRGFRSIADSSFAASKKAAEAAARAKEWERQAKVARKLQKVNALFVELDDDGSGSLGWKDVAELGRRLFGQALTAVSAMLCLLASNYM